MATLRTDIERGLDELISNEEGMRFQSLAVVLGKLRWPGLVAHQRKKDLGLDAYEPAVLAQDNTGKGLAASITPKLVKIEHDVKTAKENFPDISILIFVTPKKIGVTNNLQWVTKVREDYGVRLQIIEREDIITELLVPNNRQLLSSFLNIHTETDPQIEELITKTRRAAAQVAQKWAAKIKGHPFIDLTAEKLDSNGAESAQVLSLEDIDNALSQSRRVILEAPAGRGKTSTLVQLSQRHRNIGIAFIVELPAWTSSRSGILDFIAGFPAFQVEGVTAADLARVNQEEPFLLLLNGWNEIAASTSNQANYSLRELERDFPGAGIIVATRTHHQTPPLPGAIRLRLSLVRREQRSAYLTDRLGATSVELRTRIDTDPALDTLTRSPFVLAEVAALFEAGVEIPSTKIDILSEVICLQEQRHEHENALQAAPIFGKQADYLKAIATEMTRLGAVALPEDEARNLATCVTNELEKSGQIESTGAPLILSALTAHHLLVRSDYPQVEYQFEHHQIQEYYATIDIRARLSSIRKEDPAATRLFASRFVNDPAWAEPLRMIAELFSQTTGDMETDNHNTRCGVKLVEMAADLDLVFAGELAGLCGAPTWEVVGAAICENFRSIYESPDDSFRQIALAAMLATGSPEFSDVIEPLLSSQDQQTRFRTYDLWPEFHVSSLGSDWREKVRHWSEEARADFVSAQLHQRSGTEVAVFAATDSSTQVKRSAAHRLMWYGQEESLILVLESMPDATFEEFVRRNADQVPNVLRNKAIDALRNFINSSTDQPARLHAALELLELGEDDLEATIKGSMSALSTADLRNLQPKYIEAAITLITATDHSWASEWIATQIAAGALYDHEHWLQFANAIPDNLIERYLRRIETEDFEHESIGGMIDVVLKGADTNLAARLFTKIRELTCKLEAEPAERNEIDNRIRSQIESAFRRLPDNIAAAGILSEVTRGDHLDIKVATKLLNKLARSDTDPLQISDTDLKVRLRAYFKEGIELVLRQEDFNGEEKADLATVIAQVGESDDMADLVTIIQADIERMQRGKAALAAGQFGRVSNGGRMTYAGRHISAVVHLDPERAAQVLNDLLHEPEYMSAVAAAMACDFLPKFEDVFDQRLRHDLIWAARDRPTEVSGNDHRRALYATSLNTKISWLRDNEPSTGFVDLANALAAIDPQGSTEIVADAIALPGPWNHYPRLNAAERLLMAGAVLPTAAALALVDSILEGLDRSPQDSERYLLRRALSLCAFVDNPQDGIAKIREVLIERPLRGYELKEIVMALGESRADAAVGLLEEISTDPATTADTKYELVNALIALDTPHARELLLGAVDPNIPSIPLERDHYRNDVLVQRLAGIAQESPAVVGRLEELCDSDLPDLNREILSNIFCSLGTPDALVKNLELIDDALPTQVPYGVWEQIRNTVLDRRPSGKHTGSFTVHPQASATLRRSLLQLATENGKRQKSATKLLGEIEIMRLTYGRPPGEPRHPDIESGIPWPLGCVAMQHSEISPEDPT